VQFGTVKLRLDGIDAPQMDQPCIGPAGKLRTCGVLAREHLKVLAGDGSWTCKIVRKNHYGRLLARCLVDNDDVAQQMVRDGWAVASTTGVRRYLPMEQEARAAGAGLWAGAFVAPLDWRQHNWHADVLGQVTPDDRLSAQLLNSAFGETPPPPTCKIKGNVNWSGKCIFHKPDGRRYDRITMEVRYGDRWFCSVAEAVASGCRETKP